MIRKVNILACCLLLGALLLTACYNYDGYDNKEVGLSQSERLANADSLFLNLSIVGNSTPATRASEAEENAIYDGILCIFEGNDAATATLKTATVIDQLVYNPNEPRTVAGGSAAEINITQRLANGTHAYSSNLYALVLLNTTESGFKANANTLYHNGSSQSAKTLAQIQALTLNSVGSPDEHIGLFMSNDVLVPITPASHLFDTETEAATNFNTSHIVINVARAAACIRVTNDIPAGTSLSNIHLNGDNTIHPLIHKMKWALASELSGYTNAMDANVFSLFHQHAHESGDAVYVPAATSTQIIVEVQLKDASNVMLGDCYSFNGGSALYTDIDELIAYYKSGWPFHRTREVYDAIKDWAADDVFRNTKVVNLDNGNMMVTLLTDESIAGLTSGERKALTDLATELTGLTKSYSDGKMYFTYTIGSVLSNNAYNLSLVEQGTTDTRYVAVTFMFDQGGSGQTATYSNDCADLFASSRVVLGSNLNYNGSDANFGQTKINSSAQHNSPESTDDNIDFLFTPVTGWTFTPSSASFSTTRYGTDTGKIDIYWLYSDNTPQSLGTEIVPYRNNQVVNVLNWSSSFTAGDCDGECGLRLLLYSLKNDKSVGFSDIVIRGTLSKTVSIDNSRKSINGVGRPTPQ